MDIYPKNLIVYEIVYLPWVDNTQGLPWKYIGSTKNDLSTYFGSCSSKRWKEFWRKETKENPHLFSKRILAHCLIYDEKQEILRQLEKTIQLQENVVKNTEYFNLSLATPNGFFGMDVSGENNPRYGVKFSEEQKAKHSEIMKEIGSREEVKRRRCEVQSRLQNDPEIAEKKRIKQKQQWAMSAGLRENSSKNWFPKKRIILEDVCFLSCKDYNKFLLENDIKSKYLKHLKSLEETIIVKRCFKRCLQTKAVYYLKFWDTKDHSVFPPGYKYSDFHPVHLSELDSIVSDLLYINSNSNDFIRRKFGLCDYSKI